MLSVICLLIGIICVQYLCIGATSAEAEQAEKSANERIIYYLKNPWEDMLQNDANDGKYTCEVFAEGNEDGKKEAEKQIKGMNNCSKMLNEEQSRIEKRNPDEKMKESIFYDEQKIWGKGRNFGESMIEGCLILHNSSMKLKSLGLRQNDRENIIKAGHGSHVELNDCEVVPLSETSLFCLSGSCGLFTNISLRSSSTTFLQTFPSLFSSKALEGKYSGKCVVSVSSSHFSSFCVSSAPFLSSPSIPLVSLTHLSFFNISTATSECSSSATSFYQTSCLMSSCSFSSVCDVYYGGIVLSLNNPLASLTASNTSFIGCYRTRNAKCEGTSDGKLTPGRQNTTDNGDNSFIWCEWNGSKADVKYVSYADGKSCGGAIYVFNKTSGSLSVKYCSLNDCYANHAGGAIMCYSINSIKIENNTFNSCTAQKDYGGGLYAFNISLCVRISECEFQYCKAHRAGGGLYLEYFQISGSNCIGAESGNGESACVFDCSFISCELEYDFGGGMYCPDIPVTFKMRSVQFISCLAVSNGGGLRIGTEQSTALSDKYYCYFIFFHNCRCTNSTPYGNDLSFSDKRNLFFSYNPFYESYTTNNNNRRVHRRYYNGTSWVDQHIEKKDWLKEGMKDRYVGVRGSDSNALCGMNESAPCLTVGHAVESSIAQLSTSITVLSGNHQSEISTINIEDKIICVVGNGREESMIGTKSLSLSSTKLFSVTSGQLAVGHVGIDHNTTRDSSPSVFVVSDGSGSLSLENVVIFSSVNGEKEISASIFVMALSQLRMSDVEIKNMKMSQPLFAEPSTEESVQGESMLVNVTIRNVNRTTEGDGVVMAKSVKGGETFVVWNTTIEECECVNGNGGGIKVELLSSTSKVLIGDSISHSGGTTSFNQCKCRGYGGGVMLNLADDSFNFEITTVSFAGCAATLGGKNVFVEAQDLSAVINSTSIGFNPVVEVNKADLSELSGRERGKAELIVPLVVFFRAFSSPVYVSGREQGSEFRLCGYEDYPCRGIGNVGEVQFPS
ncbi:uncharacterized protein MONOS_6724 [Monocercomonoides exilis]|uniref:uncharacterized protein n=1 Tax=Monocercomonoides exilis TaxID=2049356 RepID=UPI0035595063|nr:hypothetical protein MONOS_6724 [Monocercomonoides exilis]|eukprot:MONOS_6724.1-p1 / transcript=MONOS_6724.1 / gene=MONOS_6724 / organism=Monocercomonoides_exilis_PA203 / gene_product=unspecified product / transcript_product=unspecified product / location=Mono_scaffold00217:9458-12496(-) / protein_length=1013 / sequence_SO=supercontig / SO=protein_coding / is_pseudo=false